MSKVLKVIVNLFLVFAILIGAAILVPPLMGISTTVIDSSATETNLSVGSVTYAKSVDVSELNVGDKVLVDSDAGTYAYVIEATDAASGEFTVIDAKNASAEPTEITLRNTVSEIVITAPLIGYIMMAMHSVEGLIIIGLVVVFIIILFVLSELWKKSDDDEEDEGEEESEKADEAVNAEEMPADAQLNLVNESEEASQGQIDEAVLIDAELSKAVEETKLSMDDSAEGLKAHMQTVVDGTPDSEAEAAEAEEAESTDVENQEDDQTEEDADSFIPVSRLSAEELLEKAKEAGEEPKVTKDEVTGVTILDYSDLI